MEISHVEPWWVVHVGYVTEDDIRVRREGREGGRGEGGGREGGEGGRGCYIAVIIIVL